MAAKSHFSLCLLMVHGVYLLNKQNRNILYSSLWGNSQFSASHPSPQGEQWAGTRRAALGELAQSLLLKDTPSVQEGV